MRSYVILIIAIFIAVTMRPVLAQTYGLGTTPTETELAALDTLVDPQGRLLPEGRGTAAEGAPLFAQRCAMCHGPNGEGTETAAGSAPQLIASSPDASEAIRSGKHYYATTLWAYIYRAMPLHQERTLSVDETYALTAYLLYRNHIITEHDVMNEENLPRVQMPGHENWKIPTGDSS